MYKNEEERKEKEEEEKKLNNIRKVIFDAIAKDHKENSQTQAHNVNDKQLKK